MMVFAGLIIRLLLIPHNGVFDMATYQQWGLNTLHKGLAGGYEGIYFPFQYQVFSFCSWISEVLNLDYFTAYKSVNLVFDCGNMILLFLLFEKFRISKYFLLLYWLHPWFILVFSQGYVDFQFSFMVLCGIYFSTNPAPRNYLIAGFFFGLAMHMKPQAQIVILSLFIYSIYMYLKERDITLFHLFVFPLIIFLDYSIYFLVLKGNPFEVLRDFFDFPNTMPLTANFLNIWYPVAYHLKAPDDPVYSVPDNIDINLISPRSIGMIIMLCLLIIYILRVGKERYSNGISGNILLLILFSTLVFPFLMTGAHENHLFLATIMMIFILGSTKKVIPSVSIHIILLIQCINLYGLYGYYDFKFFEFMRLDYSNKMSFILSLTASTAFLLVTIYLLTGRTNKLAEGEVARNDEGLPG
jgi:hypothetical protein